MSIYGWKEGFVSAYGPKISVSLSCKDNRAKQSFKEECDINRILGRFKKGQLPIVPRMDARYLDVRGADFEVYQRVIAGAKSNFNMLPAALRTEFRNDPAEFLRFVEDPANRAKGAEMGLWPKEATPPAPPAPEAPVAAPEAPNVAQ